MLESDGGVYLAGTTVGFRAGRGRRWVPTVRCARTRRAGWDVRWRVATCCANGLLAAARDPLAGWVALRVRANDGWAGFGRVAITAVTATAPVAAASASRRVRRSSPIGRGVTASRRRGRDDPRRPLMKPRRLAS